jgi:hypothetical protein
LNCQDRIYKSVPDEGISPECTTWPLYQFNFISWPCFRGFIFQHFRFPYFRPDFRRKDINCRIAHLVHQNMYRIIFTFSSKLNSQTNEKKNDFIFSINSPCLDASLSMHPLHIVFFFLSQEIRYARVCSIYDHDFICGKLLTLKLMGLNVWRYLLTWVFSAFRRLWQLPVTGLQSLISV